jgi:hypothetical protein
MDRIDDIMGKFHRHREVEVYLTTFDGEQHLRLHGWLKRHDTLIKSENIVDQSDYFGTFMVFITDKQLDNLKEDNLESGLFMDLEIMSTESERLNIFNHINKDSFEKDLEKIQDFMFSFQIKSKDDINKFLIQANETSLTLFKKNKSFINDYVETSEMSEKDKLTDLELMIETFIEEERYEDCALLVKIKNKVIKYYEKTLIKK